MIVRTDPLAARELRAAVRWYETQRTGLGAEFLDAAEAALGLVRARPEAGTVVSEDRRTRRALVGRFPYQIVYRLRPTEIVVVAVAHLKRRPGYWTERG